MTSPGCSRVKWETWMVMMYFAHAPLQKVGEMHKIMQINMIRMREGTTWVRNICTGQVCAVVFVFVCTHEIAIVQYLDPCQK